MSEMGMVERVRDAIFDAIERTALDANCLALQAGRIHFDGDFDAWVVARAAIEALRGMGADAIQDAFRKANYDAGYGSKEDVWRNLIDAVLSEPSTGRE